MNNQPPVDDDTDSDIAVEENPSSTEQKDEAHTLTKDKTADHSKEITNPTEKPDKKHDDKKGHQNIIIIKRVKKVVHGHHGGAWKIAYADFVTAMMTFFLLMWLLSMLNKYQLQGISDYFKRPIKNVIAEKTDPKNDMVKTQDTSTTNKSPKVHKVNEAANTVSVPKAQENKLASEQMKTELEKQLKSNPKVSQYQNVLNFKVTSQGLKIELKDLKDKPMFSSGKTDFADYASSIIEWLSATMNKYPNRVMIVGHTDSNPIQGSDQYTNWELSADRANATRRELVQFGMDPSKVVRIVGAADVDKLDNAPDTKDAANRRIDIIILNDDAYNKMQNE